MHFLIRIVLCENSYKFLMEAKKLTTKHINTNHGFIIEIDRESLCKLIKLCNIRIFIDDQVYLQSGYYIIGYIILNDSDSIRCPRISDIFGAS